MNAFRVRFDDIEWQHARHGVRQKVHCEGGHIVRLVAFDTAGDALVIPAGAATKHRATTMRPARGC